MPARHDPDLPAGIDEAKGLRSAYDRHPVGRRHWGRVASWFYATTATGALRREVQGVLKHAGADRNLWYYVVPGSQAG